MEKIMDSKSKLSELWALTKKYKKFVIALVILITLIVLVTLFSTRLDAFHPKRAKEFVLGFGTLAPVVFIILQIAQVIFAPIPGQATGLAGGFVFGWELGVAYTTLGLAIGTFIVLALSRKFGRSFVEKFNAPEAIAEFEKLLIPPDSKASKGVSKIKQHGLLTFFLIMLLPALPDDLVCFVAGLSKIPIWKLLIAAIVGRFPGMLVLSLVGDGFSTGEANLFNFIFIGFWVIVTLIYFWKKKQIESWLLKLARKGGERE
jgi:uncharacterized membrane protein YdjX (TVP38/TMEM64 family)